MKTRLVVLFVCIIALGLAALLLGTARANIGGSTVNSLSPAEIAPGVSTQVCFNVSVSTTDDEYIDRFDVDLPDNWNIGAVAANSIPPADGGGVCSPSVSSAYSATEKVVSWQTVGYPSGCGAWDPGTYNFCVNVTVPDCAGAPWSLPWNMIGDHYEGTTEPHTVNGILPGVACSPSGPYVEIAKYVEPPLAFPGTPITYTLAFTNAGDAIAIGVMVTDSVPLSVTNPVVVGSSGAVITQTGSSPNFAWQVQDLAPGVGGVITLRGVLSPGLPLGEVITNTVSITSPGSLAPQTGSAALLICGHQLSVTSPADDGPGTLRQAIAGTCPGGRITFNGDTSIYLASELAIAKRLTIDGEHHTITVSGDTGNNGSSNVRVFNIAASGVVTLSHLSIVNGAVTGGNGGGIYSEGTLTVQDSLFSGNSATSSGGGIYNKGTLTVQNSTFSGNSAATYYGGGIRNTGTLTVQNSTFSGNSADSGGGLHNTGTLTVQNSTFSGNSAKFGGGGIYNWGTLGLQNSTLSGNSASSGGGIYNLGTLIYANAIIANSASGGDCYNDTQDGTISTNIHNLVEDGTCSSGGISFLTGDPLLGLLADNGGDTRTHALLPGSPAIGTGNNATCLATDQRGFPRPYPAGGACDMGAYEVGPLRLVKTAAPATDAPYHGLVTYTLVLSNTGGVQDPGVWLTDTLPAEVNFDSWVISPTQTTLNGDEIRWHGSLDAGQAVTFTFQVRHTGDYGDHVTNLARFGGALDSGSGQASFDVGCAPTYTVQNANDSGTGSLRQAIRAGVCSGGRITFSGDTSIYLSSELAVAKRLTIDGEDHAITVSGDTGNDGSSNVRVFNIAASGVVTISHLSVVSGTVPYGNGGGIYNEGTLTLQSSTLSGNSASSSGSGSEVGGWGGGIYNLGTLSVKNSTLSGNEAEFGGGGIYNYRGTLAVQDSTFSDNSADSYWGTGGGISNYSTLTVQNSTFSGNSANSGGGIYNNDTLTIQGSTLSGNSAKREGGGGIHNDWGTLTVQNSTFSGNSSSAGGGGIWNTGSGSQATLTHVTLSRNVADADNDGDGDGGGIFTDDSATLYLKNAIVAGNDDRSTPGKDDCSKSGATLTSQGYNLVGSGTGCPSGGTGDRTTPDPLLGLLADNGGDTWTHALLPGSPAIDHGICVVGITLDQRGFPRPYPAGGACDMGAYEIGPLRLSKTATPAASAPYHGLVTYTLVLSNTGGVQDPSVWLTDTLPAEVTFDSWVISPTHTTLTGDEIRWHDALGAGQVVTFTFQVRHTGEEGGRAVMNLAYFRGASDRGSGQASFDVECIPAYTVQNTNDSGAGSLRQAIAAVCPGGSVTFSGDTSIYLSSELAVAKRLTIDGEDHAITVSGDTGNNGSSNVRVFNIAATGVVTISHLSIVSGTVDDGGGGIYNEGTLTLQESTLTGNSAGYGGGIYNEGLLTVQNSTLSGNSAINGGGGIFNLNTAKVIHSTLSGNSVPGSHVGGGGIYNGNMLTVQSSTLSGNSSSPGGGGIENRNTLTVTQSTLTNNLAGDGTALGTGGGFLNMEGTAYLSNSTFSGNDARGTGGNGGGGIMVDEGTVTLVNCTITGNHSATYGGGVSLPSTYNPVLHLYNTIVAGNTAVTSGPDLSGAVNSHDYNLIQNTSGATIGGQTSHNITGAAALLGPLADNGGNTWTHALLPGSPAIDAVPVDRCMVSTDQRGVPRPQGAHCDMGAYERESSEFLIYLPLVLR